ncbi:hypothetical protein K2173_027350 [Erythroxylum novogranatense]|uniref:BRF2-like C-terminal domain-containing protein n=1 Tax=Erythroxylum novogranatense TaxID=1862640 RepID=A0AAV8U2M9_9ROSI|nr:hypothetical protein K2173_027350 [Erythroxylum novogranatense]
MPCCSCGHRSLLRDDVTGSLLCELCGIVQPFDNFEVRTGGIHGPEGVFIHLGSSGTGSVLNYRDKKIYEAIKLIDEITFKLDITSRKVADVKEMIGKITDGEFGAGDWFLVLIGACAYVTMRSDNRSLSIAETSSVVGCDLHELGRMIMRVVNHMNIKLPEFDIVSSFERVVRNLWSLGRVDTDKIEKMRKQGVFLIQCMVKWFLTTGRRPLPVVVAVVVLVSELNGVEGIKIENVAREVHSVVSTCRSRYKELLEALVKAAQILPWGSNVTVKNVVKNVPLLMRYMEIKSMEKSDGKEEILDSVWFDLGDVVTECLAKDFRYGDEVDCVECDDSRYFELQGRNRVEKADNDDLDKLQLSQECLSMLYDKFLEGGGGKYSKESAVSSRRKRNRGLELHATEWWDGKSELSKKLILKQILEMDVGFDAMPPSFVRGCMANERRRAKIYAAKLRVQRIMNPWSANSIDGSKLQSLEVAYPQKRKRKTQENNLDWEDFVIETLLLHQVKEEELEKGNYNTLLDLHVFNSGVS